MFIVKCAIKNLLGAGLRTWLNCVVLGITMVFIVFLQGFYQGFENTMKRARIAEEVGQGQYWQEGYDALDPLTFDDSHARMPQGLQELVKQGKATPILIRTASVYPQGRMQNLTLKGISPEQNILTLPSGRLQTHDGSPALIIGQRMADLLGVHEGETLTVRFKTAHGAIDAREFLITAVFHAAVPAIDLGQLWVAQATLEGMVDLPDEATQVVLGNAVKPDTFPGFVYKSQAQLLKETTLMIAWKEKQAMVIYALLIFVAMISIFDSQLLAVFRRRKEIGLHLALGLTQQTIVVLFTLEGMMHGILAALLGTLVGGPLFMLSARWGIPLPHMVEKFGVAANNIYPIFSWQLLGGTFALIMLILSVVSYLPARGIAAMSPTQALRGS